MRYIYFPKLLKALENIEQYNELLPYGIRATNTSFSRIKSHRVWDVYRGSYYTRVLPSVHGKYIRYCIAPVHCDISEYAEANDTVFYVYDSSKDCSLTRKTISFIIRTIERSFIHPSDPASRNVQSYEKGEAALVVLKQLVKDYESEDAFRKDVLENHHFELTDSLFAFTGINSNLDDLDSLAKSIYAPVKTSSVNDICEFYNYKLSSVLNEIDFLADGADYDQLDIYAFLLHDDFTRNSKQLSALQNNTQIVKLLQRRDEVRKQVVKTKQLISQGRKMSLRLDDLSLEDIKPKQIKLRLQW